MNHIIKIPKKMWRDTTKFYVEETGKEPTIKDVKETLLFWLESVITIKKNRVE